MAQSNIDFLFKSGNLLNNELMIDAEVTELEDVADSKSAKGDTL